MRTEIRFGTLLERAEQARLTIDLGIPAVERLAIAALLTTRQTSRSETLRQLGERRDALGQALAEHLPHVHAARPPGGMALWATFPAPISSRLAAIAPEHGVTFAAGPRLGIGGAFERSNRLPYTLPRARLTQAIHSLAEAEQALARGATGIHTSAPVA